jgi:hypothetical protein
MSIDVIDLRSFYSSALGEVARRVVHKIVRQRFSNCTGYSILGVGYATPYLEVFREEAVRVLAFMPAEQGVVNWPCARNHRTSARASFRNLAHLDPRRPGHRRRAQPLGSLGTA